MHFFTPSLGQVILPVGIAGVLGLGLAVFFLLPAIIEKEFAQVETIKKFRLLEKELDHDDDELTATLKLRRKTVNQKFGHIIQEMYSSRN